MHIDTYNYLTLFFGAVVVKAVLRNTYIETVNFTHTPLLLSCYQSTLQIPKYEGHTKLPQ